LWFMTSIMQICCKHK